MGSLGPTRMLLMPVILKDIYALKKYGANNTTESATSHSERTRFRNPCQLKIHSKPAGSGEQGAERAGQKNGKVQQKDWRIDT